MTTEALIATSIARHSTHARATSEIATTEALGEQIAALAARLHAATYELLVLLREFDARTGWNNGFLSCAHWLHWRTGHRPRRRAREGARGPGAAGAAARQRHACSAGSSPTPRCGRSPAWPRPRTRRRCSTCAGRHRRACGALRARLAACGPRAARAEQTETRHLNRQLSHVGGRRRHGRHPRTAHARGGRRGAARARGGGRSAVPRGAAGADGPRDVRGADAGPASGRRPRPAGRGRADGGSRRRHGRATAIRWCCTSNAERRVDAPARPRRRAPQLTACRWRPRGRSRRALTFPRKRLAGLSCDASMVQMRHDAVGDWCSTWAQDPHDSAVDPPRTRRRATQAAASRAARPAAATPIMSSIGPTAARRVSTTCCCCAGGIIAPSTRVWSTFDSARTARSPSSAPTDGCLNPHPTRPCPSPVSKRCRNGLTTCPRGTAPRSTSPTRRSALHAAGIRSGAVTAAHLTSRSTALSWPSGGRRRRYRRAWRSARMTSSSCKRCKGWTRYRSLRGVAQDRRRSRTVRPVVRQGRRGDSWVSPDRSSIAGSGVGRS